MIFNIHEYVFINVESPELSCSRNTPGTEASHKQREKLPAILILSHSLCSYCVLPSDNAVGCERFGGLGYINECHLICIFSMNYAVCNMHTVKANP